jgi:hypothetical protein
MEPSRLRVSQDSIVNVVAGLRTERSGFKFWQGHEILSVFQNVHAGSEVHPLSYSMGTETSFSGRNRPWLETDHPAPPHAEVKNEWSYTSTPVYAFVASTGTTLLYRTATYS